MALTRLDWVLAQDAGNADALTLRQQAAAAEDAARAAGSGPLPTAEPRPTAQATPEEVITDDERLSADDESVPVANAEASRLKARVVTVKE